MAKNFVDKLNWKKTGNTEPKNVEKIPNWELEGREPIEGIDYPKENTVKSHVTNFVSKLNWKKN